MHSDNKRVLDVSKLKLNEEMLLDRKPFKDISQGENLRFIGKLNKIKKTI